MSFKNWLRPRLLAHAHCDIPCGVYDPEQARIEAESCYKIIEKYHASNDEVFRQRCIVVKEERAELAKHHLDVLWSDYYKPDKHDAAHPKIKDVFNQAVKTASKVKQGVNKEDAQKLLELIDQIDDFWQKTNGPKETRVQRSVVAKA
jgi:nickel superoxide dismutase